MKFTKMQGTGNDFIMINALEEKLPNNLEEFAKNCNVLWGLNSERVEQKVNEFSYEVLKDLVIEQGYKAEFIDQEIMKKAIDKTYDFYLKEFK